MPPFLPRKRLRSNSPKPEAVRSKNHQTTPRKSTLFDDLDSGLRPARTLEHNKALLSRDDGDSSSSLSEPSDIEFEDVPTKRQKTMTDEEDDEDEDMEFEDVQTHEEPRPSDYRPSGDLELTLTKETRISLTNPLGTKKGPSKIERGIRIATHQMHVQTLMWHNSIRNSWLCDKEVQKILVGKLPPFHVQKIDKWRNDIRLDQEQEQKDTPGPKGETKGKAKSNDKDSKGKKAAVRGPTDWGQPATGELNLSLGYPTYKLLKYLMHFWERKFRVTAPGLRKLGYMSLAKLDEEMKSFNNDEHDAERHGERIKDIREFRECAKSLEGSRDVGAQLFTALLRGIGLEARMVASIQPVGFAWTKFEDADENNLRKTNIIKKAVVEASDEDEDMDSTDEGQEVQEAVHKKGKPSGKQEKENASSKDSKNGNKGKRPAKDPVGSDSELSDLSDISEDNSVVDITPARKLPKPSRPYDKDLRFPHYWTEVLSPVTHTYTALDATVLHTIAMNQAHLEKFEPRGAKSEKAKQVTAYIVGHSSDGTAKDVTVRYLKRRMYPGRTKGSRLPIEKIPVHNKHGKVNYYDEYDWFKTVMRSYVRGSKKYPRTEVDDNEESTDLKVVQPVKKEVKDGEETLQFYKSSDEFVLERHLKREEALLPNSKHVKMFTVKGKGKVATEERVFLRKDVVSCKSMETWHKEGRAPLPDEEPLKRVPYRAATTNRKRELAEAEHATGEKMLQGLYSRAQTDWIIPPPIENGVIPKNSYGNMDVYTPSMVPEGAVHIPRRGTVKVCKRLGIDYAEAVTGFEFGMRMAIPIVTGVVVAMEHLDSVIEEWEKDEQERERKEDAKRTAAAIGMWRKMLMGMRIQKRVREEYGDGLGDEADVLNPWINKNKPKKSDHQADEKAQEMAQRDEEMAGGFFPDGHDEEDPDPHHSSSFFPVAQEDDEGQEDGGGFVIEDDKDESKPGAAQTHDRAPKFEFSKTADDEENVEMYEEVAPKPKRPKPTAKSPAPVRKKPSQPPRQTRKAAKKTEPANDEDSTSSLSDIESSESDSESNSRASPPPRKPTPKKSRTGRSAARRATLPSKTETPTRSLPRRQAARKSETALKSHYFGNSGDDEDGE